MTKKKSFIVTRRRYLSCSADFPRSFELCFTKQIFVTFLVYNCFFKRKIRHSLVASHADGTRGRSGSRQRYPS